MVKETTEIIEEKIQRTKRLVLYTSYDSHFVNKIEELQKKYPEEILNIQGISNKARDLNEFSKKFFSKSASKIADITVDQNANFKSKTVSQYTVQNNKANLRLNGLYLIWKYIKKNELQNRNTEETSIETANIAIEKVINGELFINDLASVEKPYCWAQSLELLVYEGMKFIDGNIKIGPPKRLTSFIHLVIQSIAYMSNQLAGAISLPDLFVYWDWFNRKEFGEDYINNKELNNIIKNNFQNFIYSCNFEFRTGESPFTNVSIMDKGFLESLFKDKVYPDFTKVNINSVYEFSKRFFEYFSEMNMKEGIFTFPIITLACSVKDDKFIDEDFVDWVCKVNSEKALGNIYTGDPTSLSSCCRLQNNIKTFTDYQNSFGVSGVSIGSHRVCGINLPRLIKDYTENEVLNQNEFIHALQDRINYCKKILDAHRKIIKYHIEIGVLPLYTYNWMNLDKQYSTIGIIGVYELQQYYNKLNNIEDKAKNITNYSFALDVLKVINKNISEWNKLGTSKYNLEQIPGESVAIRLAEVDKVLGKNTEYKLYSNQYVPLIQNNISISDRFKIQGKFDTQTSGGSILHINIDESEKISELQMKKLFELALKTKTIYWALNYIYIQCSSGHSFIGSNETKECPICGSNNLTYFTRVVGFITNVKDWNPTRRDWEFSNRKFYSSVIIKGE